MSAVTLAHLENVNRVVQLKVPLVNYGGCGFYATLIQRRLAELGLTTETGLIAYDPPNGADHVFTVVAVDGIEYFHDGEETLCLDKWMKTDFGKYFPIARVSADETLQVVNTNRWNPTFEPIGHIEILCSIIEDVLGPFEQRPHFNTIQGVRI